MAAIGATPQAAVEQRAFKRSYLGDRDEAARILRALRTAGLSARVIASHGRLIDVLPRKAGKAAAMAHAARLKGLSLDDCVAAGDSGNDICMLKAAGAAVLPANARDELGRLPARDGLVRASKRHAAGVLEGLARLGLGAERKRSVAASSVRELRA